MLRGAGHQRQCAHACARPCVWLWLWWWGGSGTVRVVGASAPCTRLGKPHLVPEEWLLYVGAVHLDPACRPSAMSSVHRPYSMDTWTGAASAAGMGMGHGSCTPINPVLRCSQVGADSPMHGQPRTPTSKRPSPAQQRSSSEVEGASTVACWDVHVCGWHGAYAGEGSSHHMYL